MWCTSGHHAVALISVLVPPHCMEMRRFPFLQLPGFPGQAAAWVPWPVRQPRCGSHRSLRFWGFRGRGYNSKLTHATRPDPAPRESSLLWRIFGVTDSRGTSSAFSNDPDSLALLLAVAFHIYFLADMTHRVHGSRIQQHPQLRNLVCCIPILLQPCCVL